MYIFGELLWSIRTWEHANLPLRGRATAIDVLLVSAMYQGEGKPLSIKELEAILPHSPRGLRYALESLLTADLCVVLSSEADRRVRLVVPTANGVNVLDEYASFICQKTIQITTKHPILSNQNAHVLHNKS